MDPRLKSPRWYPASSRSLSEAEYDARWRAEYQIKNATSKRPGLIPTQRVPGPAGTEHDLEDRDTSGHRLGVTLEKVGNEVKRRAA
jgi:hypothetical protein